MAAQGLHSVAGAPALQQQEAGHARQRERIIFCLQTMAGIPFLTVVDALPAVNPSPLLILQAEHRRRQLMQALIKHYATQARSRLPETILQWAQAHGHVHQDAQELQ